jgi:hypothetical protein
MTTNTGQSEITARLLKQHHAAIYAKKKGDENNQLLANTENVQPPPADSVQQAHVVNEPKPPSLSPPIVIWCCRCEKPSSVICGPCQANRHRNTFYCSRECQKADWKKHRPFCGLQFPEKMPVIFKGIY